MRRTKKLERRLRAGLLMNRHNKISKRQLGLGHAIKGLQSPPPATPTEVLQRVTVFLKEATRCCWTLALADAHGRGRLETVYSSKNRRCAEAIALESQPDAPDELDRLSVREAAAWTLRRLPAQVRPLLKGCQEPATSPCMIAVPLQARGRRIGLLISMTEPSCRNRKQITATMIRMARAAAASLDGLVRRQDSKDGETKSERERSAPMSLQTLESDALVPAFPTQNGNAGRVAGTVPGSGSTAVVHPSLQNGRATERIRLSQPPLAAEYLRLQSVPRRRVLVVDDERAVADLLTETLRRKGISASAAYGARQALDMLDASSFDVALLDVKMPEISGLELLKRIRGSRIDLPIVLMTGGSRDGVLANADARSFAPCLQKPFESGILISAIEQRLAEHAGSSMRR